MTGFYRWKSGTAALIAMAVSTGAIAPIFTIAPAHAQPFRSQTRDISIPAGVKFPVTYEKDRVIVTADESTPLTVRIARNIIDRNGNVLIPEGSQLVGQIEPATRDSQKGSRFVARELVFPDGKRQDIDASSQIVTRTEKISKGTDTGKILQDAAIGAGAASVIGLITDHRIRAIEPILGGAAGAGASVLLRRKTTEVVVIKPQSGDLDVKLRSSLLLSRY
ncbi:MAG: conjugal transfer protein TrbI [Stigonema ocellatum SAG 48.90 = DSM 106950]|nr:conjugal transfer protein TrbI [Stigonema ocellatum SAG 48.90 = DSM 106950]